MSEAEITAKTVDEYLNATDYSDDPSYVPSFFALHFVNFIKLVNGDEGEENLTPVLHFKMLDQIAGPISDIVNMIHRGAAKTTVFGEYLFLYIAVYGEIPGFGLINVGIYVSDSIDNGVKNMRKNLEFRWGNSEFLKKTISRIRFTDARWEFENAAGKILIIKGYGAKTGVRGTKEMGERPTLAVLDDLLSDEDARSATVIASIEDTVYKALEHALHTKKHKIIWSGTPFNAKDPLYKAVESGAWTVNVYPVCESFPCTREEFRGSWPDRFTYDFVLAKYTKAKKAGKIDTFDQELMLRIMSNDDRLVPDENLRWMDTSKILDNRNAFNFYITTDFGTSENEATDFSCIVVWAYNNNLDWIVVDGQAKRQDMGKNIKDLFMYVAKYRPLSVGIEVSGQQGGFIPWIQEQMLTRNCYFNLATGGNNDSPGIRPSTKKLVRFQVAVPLFTLGKVYLPADKPSNSFVVEALVELRLASAGGLRSKKDDAIDTISMITVMEPCAPGEYVDVIEHDDGVWGIDERKQVGGSVYDNYVV